MAYRNFCSVLTEISVCHTTKISVRHTTEISVKLTSKAEDTSYCSRNFFTGERVLNSEAVGHVLSLMSSCGMSIYSGQFAFNVSSIFGFGFS